VNIDKVKDRPQVVVLTTKHSPAPQLKSVLPSLHSQKPNNKMRRIKRIVVFSNSLLKLIWMLYLLPYMRSIQGKTPSII